MDFPESLCSLAIRTCVRIRGGGESFSMERTLQPRRVAQWLLFMRAVYDSFTYPLWLWIEHTVPGGIPRRIVYRSRGKCRKCNLSVGHNYCTSLHMLVSFGAHWRTLAFEFIDCVLEDVWCVFCLLDFFPNAFLINS